VWQSRQGPLLAHVFSQVEEGEGIQSGRDMQAARPKWPLCLDDEGEVT